MSLGATRSALTGRLIRSPSYLIQENEVVKKKRQQCPKLPPALPNSFPSPCVFHVLTCTLSDEFRGQKHCGVQTQPPLLPYPLPPPLPASKKKWRPKMVSETAPEVATERFGTMEPELWSPEVTTETAPEVATGKMFLVALSGGQFLRAKTMLTCGRQTLFLSDAVFLSPQ